MPLVCCMIMVESRLARVSSPAFGGGEVLWEQECPYSKIHGQLCR